MPKMKEFRQDYWSRVETKVGECYQWKATGQCARGDSCSFSHGPNRGSKAQSSSPAPQAWTQLRKRTLDNFWSQKRESFWNEKSERVPKNTQKILHESVGRLLAFSRVKITTLNRNANSATVVCSDTLKLLASPVRSRRTVVEKMSCFTE